MNRKKVDIADLRRGMYVAELDRPWDGTPFPFQGFVLRTDRELDALRKFCSWVHVDLDRDESEVDDTAVGVTPLPGIGKQTYAETSAIEQEIPRARDLFASSETVVADALRDFSQGSAPALPALKEEVSKITDSVLRNPHAVALLSAMREGAEYLVDRAMHTSVYLIVFTRFLGMERADIERAGIVGLLQDFAMTRLPGELIMKKGALSPDELAQVRQHVEEGRRQLKELPGLAPEIPDLAAMHHERHDGSGYPKGLKGGQIPTIAACSALVDTYSAMTRARPYAEPIPPSKALGLLHRWKGRTFHPTLVEEFIRCLGAFPVGSVVELNSGEVGIVISQEPSKRLQPRVLVVRDAGGNPLRPHKLLDLSRSPKATPDEVYRIRRTLEFGKSGVHMRDLQVA